MKLRYRLLFRCKLCLKIQRWYRWKFHKERTIENFKALLEELDKEVK